MYVPATCPFKGKRKGNSPTGGTTMKKPSKVAQSVTVNPSNDRSQSDNQSTAPVAMPTPHTQQTVKEAIAANVQLLIEQLEQGQSEGLTAYLTAMGRFHRYSFGNILEIARQKPQASRVAGMYAWNQLGRRVMKGEKGIRILAPVIGIRRKKDEEANKDIRIQNQAVLVGFRSVYVFDRLSRDLRPCTACQHAPPRGGASGVLLNGSSHIIAQFTGALQGGLNANEFQFAGGDLSGWFVVSLCCV